MKNNPWNIRMEKIEVPQKYIDMLDETRRINGSKKTNRIGAPSELIEYLEHLYFDEEYGIKAVARGFGYSYSEMRRGLINYMPRPIRTGRDVITARMVRFRSARVTGDKNPWYDWTNQNKKPIKNSRGIQGYYKKRDGTTVWLRSTWEYIYAKWLDRHNVKWSIETTVFKLSNNERYRPDFFIFDNKDELQYIVEIKGYYKNRLYKYELFKKEYSIPIILIDCVDDYCKNYKKELKLWKSQRLKLKG